MGEHRGVAPGRVNLLGEHTDYNEGWVLPMAIPQQATAIVVPESGPRVRARTANTEPPEMVYELGHESTTGTWIDYIQGLTWALRSAGHRLNGFSLEISSEVPTGSGLSSSAALEIATLRALRAAFALPLDDLTLARLGHQAETDFVGVPVGMLDQMACTFASEEHALFIDTRTLAFHRLPLPAASAIVVLDSGQYHQHGSGSYRARRSECEQAARLLGVRSLRDVVDESALTELPNLYARRARHVLRENARVHSAVAALRRGDGPALGRLLDDSHASMRDDFECSTEQIDRWIDEVRTIPHVYGARLTGGGFGGAIVVLAARDRTREVAERAAALGNTIPGLRAVPLVS